MAPPQGDGTSRGAPPLVRPNHPAKQLLDGRKVVVVDDSAVARHFVQTTLGSFGCNVIALDSALGASGVVRREKPDIIVMDLVMPGLRGDEVIEVMRRHAVSEGTTIVLFSSRPEREAKEAVERSGADGYIPKTRDGLTFISRLMRILLDRARAQRMPGI